MASKCIEKIKRIERWKHLICAITVSRGILFLFLMKLKWNCVKSANEINCYRIIFLSYLPLRHQSASLLIYKLSLRDCQEDITICHQNGDIKRKVAQSKRVEIVYQSPVGEHFHLSSAEQQVIFHVLSINFFFLRSIPLGRRIKNANRGKKMLLKSIWNERNIQHRSQMQEILNELINGLVQQVGAQEASRWLALFQATTPAAKHVQASRHHSADDL